MRRNVELLRRRLVKSPRYFALPLFLLLLLAVVVPGTLTLEVATATDRHGNTHAVMTNSQSKPEEILEQTGFAQLQLQGESYSRQPAQAAKVETVALAVVNRVHEVSLHVDGQVLRQTAVTGTVEDILERCSVVLAESYFVEPALDTQVTGDMEIHVYRVSYSEEQVRSDVPVALVEEYERALAEADPQAAFTRSRSGIYDVAYRHTLANGEVVESEVVSLSPVVTPNDPANTEFVDGLACSSIDRFEGVEFDENGLPTNYSRKISDAITTAYSSSAGRGSSGMGLYCGTVAVNPKEIPYGTKLYIVSPDGSFVYGFAIASDTGTALVDGRIDIDVYFESNAECYKFGKRKMDVYIFE